MLGALAVTPLTQAEAIRQATARSVRHRNRYTEQTVAELTGMLSGAEDDVRGAILRYKSLGSLPDNKLAALEGLKKLQADLREAMTRLRRDQTLRFRQATRTSFRQGIAGGIQDFAAAQLPFYRDLTRDGIDQLATRAFTLIDTDALDFMSQYNLVLAGDVHRELAGGIRRAVMSGIVTGKGVEDIVRDLGHVVKDPESFRHAGSKVFRKAQYRMEVIARTEVLRTHNQGRLKFHQQVGVEKLEWMTMEDERVCPVCGPLDGRRFDTGRFPQQPAHLGAGVLQCRVHPAAAGHREAGEGEVGGDRQAQGRVRKRLDRRPGRPHGQAAADLVEAERRLHRPHQGRLHQAARPGGARDQSRRPFGRRPEGQAQGTQDRPAAHQAGTGRTPGRKQAALKHAQQLAEQLKKVPASGGQPLPDQARGRGSRVFIYPKEDDSI